jgi:RimJ/RimL family protein N-acetyltransferase
MRPGCATRLVRDRPLELTVRTDNLNAKALYERVGFCIEGLSRRAFLVDGQYYDAYSMSLLR